MQGERLDKQGIMQDLAKDPELRFAFRTAASTFHLIDDTQQETVIVRYCEGASYVSQLERKGPERWLMRKLQRYVVNLPRYQHQKLLASGAIRELQPGIFIQGYTSMYDEEIGFCADRSMIYEPDELIG